MSETFLSRWSRRKRAASIPPPQGEGGEDRRSEPGGGEHSQPELAKTPTPDPSPTGGLRPPLFENTPTRSVGYGSAREEGDLNSVPFDPASLPPIESIGAATDVSAFLRPGVPADLTQAALRRAWVADPAIRDFVGPAENAWDFNAPDGVPGFGPLRAIDDVQRLAAMVAGVLPPDDAEAAVRGKEEAAETRQAAVPPAPVPDEAPASADLCAPQQDAQTEREGMPQRPRHGGALAE